MQARRAAAIAALTAFAVVIVLSAIPGAPAVRAIRPGLTVAAVDQDWRIFAPEPRRDGVRVEALIAWSDGARTVWRMPSGEPLFGAYRDYRWRKWAEHAASDEIGPWLWGPLARYVVRQLPSRAPSVPTRLTIVRRTQAVPPPGTGDAPGWVATEVYRAELGT
jgi:hypothetical protein